MWPSGTSPLQHLDKNMDHGGPKTFLFTTHHLPPTTPITYYLLRTYWIIRIINQLINRLLD